MCHGVQINEHTGVFASVPLVLKPAEPGPGHNLISHVAKSFPLAAVFALHCNTTLPSLCKAQRTQGLAARATGIAVRVARGVNLKKTRTSSATIAVRLSPSNQRPKLEIAFSPLSRCRHAAVYFVCKEAISTVGFQRGRAIVLSTGSRAHGCADAAPDSDAPFLVASRPSHASQTRVLRTGPYGTVVCGGVCCDVGDYCAYEFGEYGSGFACTCAFPPSAL